MREVVHTLRDGRKQKVLIPDNAPDSHAAMGVLVGPPDLDALQLPTALEVRLHNELFNRGLFTRKDVQKRPQEVFAALQSALRVDVAAIANLYPSEGS